jgi:hypothetical protein
VVKIGAAVEDDDWLALANVAIKEVGAFDREEIFLRR